MPERSVAMIRTFSPALNRSLLVGGALAVAVGILLTPLLVTRLPTPLEVIVTALLGGLIGLLAAYLAFPATIRRAYETFGWLGRAEVDRFEQRTRWTRADQARRHRPLARHDAVRAGDTAAEG